MNPIELTSTDTYDSVSIPGGRYTLRKWSPKRRREYNMAMAGPLHEYRLVQDELTDIYAKARAMREAVDLMPCNCGHAQHFGPDDADGIAGIKECPEPGCGCNLPRRDANLEPADQLTYSRLRERESMLSNDEMGPIRLRWAVASIEGIVVDGKPLDVDGLIDNGPDELANEITAKILETLFPSPKLLKNSSSPTTSQAPVAGTTNNTGADTASVQTSNSGGGATVV